MEIRHLLERENQLEMLDEFDELLEMSELVASHANHLVLKLPAIGSGCLEQGCNRLQA
ncbi:MAG: hypothetical protein OXC57_08490 [Rhodobacteraceae bacterium]|nr:hypothetical protein [Paracoccaceae bacterium]